MQLESTLAQFPLIELIPMIEGSSVTGCLELGEASSGKIFFRDGNMYHAESENYVGLAALCQIFTYEDAPFRFTAGPHTDNSSLWQQSEDLVRFAQNYAETWASVRRVIPSMQAIPLLQQHSTTNVVMNDTTWRMLSMIDGQRSVEQIAHELNQQPLEVAVALRSLVEQGVVKMFTGLPSAPSLPSTVAKGSQSGGKGFLRRLMST